MSPALAVLIESREEKLEDEDEPCARSEWEFSKEVVGDDCVACLIGKDFRQSTEFPTRLSMPESIVERALEIIRQREVNIYETGGVPSPRRNFSRTVMPSFDRYNY